MAAVASSHAGSTMAHGAADLGDPFLSSKHDDPSLSSEHGVASLSSKQLWARIHPPSSGSGHQRLWESSTVVRRSGMTTRDTGLGGLLKKS